MALNWDRARKQALEIDKKYNTARSVTPGASSGTAYVPGTSKYTAAANITPKRTVTALPNAGTPTADRARLGLATGGNPVSDSLTRFTRERESEAMARTGSEAEALKLQLDTLSARKAALEEGLPKLRAAEQPSEVARESLMRTAQGWSQRQELEEPERGSDRVSARIEALDQEYNSLLPQYYAAKNEATLRRMEGDGALKSLYAQAKGLREDLDRAALAQTGGGAAGAQGDGGAAGAAWTDLQKKYGVSRAAELPALHERLLREFGALEEQLAAQGVDYEYLRAYEQMAEDRAAWVEKQAETEAYAREHPVMASVESVLKSPMQGLDLLSLGTPGAGRNDPDSPDTYVPLNVYGMDVSNFVNTVRGTVSKEIEQNTDWELFGQNVASFLYQTGMSVADSAAQVALFGPGATYLMGASAAANQAREVIERGGTNRQALLSGLAAGAAEALFEKVSVERLLSERSVRSMRDLLAETLKQAGTEASEEMLTEVSNLLSDAAIMGSGSNFAARVERHRQEGLSEEEARRRAFLDCLSQVAWAGAGGALSGGMMGGTVRGANYLSGAWNQAQSAGAAGTTGQNHTASTEQAGEYRANRPQNVELPNVPIINLSMQSVADMNGGVLPQTGNALRKDAIARARIRLGLDKNSAAYIPASNVTRNGDEYVLKITKASLNKMLSPADGNAVQTESIVVLDNIERIANNGVWFDSQGDRKGRPQINGIDHLKTVVYIDGIPYEVDMRVRLVQENAHSGQDNVLYYFTPEEVVAIKKVDTAPPTGERRALTGASEGVSTFAPIISENPAGGNARSARNRAGVTAVGDEYLQQALDEVWQGADGPSVRGPQEDGIQSRGATPVWEAAAVPNNSAGSGQRILEEGWRDEAPSVRGPEENGVHNLEGLQLLDSAENAGYDESTVWEAHRELDQDGNPVYAVTRREANIQPEDLRALQRKQRETAKQLGMDEAESSRLEQYVRGFLCYSLNKRMNLGTQGGGEQEIAADIQRALEKFPQYNGRAYRNLKFDSKEEYDAFLAEYAEGSSVTLRAFTSTSKRPNGYPLFGGGVVHLVVDGYSGRDIADTYGLSRQQEVLYLPGTEMSVIRVTTANDGNPLIYLKEADDGKHRGENSEDFGDRGPA